MVCSDGALEGIRNALGGLRTLEVDSPFDESATSDCDFNCDEGVASWACSFCDASDGSEMDRLESLLPDSESVWSLERNRRDLNENFFFGLADILKMKAGGKMRHTRQMRMHFV